MIEIQISNWQTFVSTTSNTGYRSWAFRGHADAKWPILSTLSRAFCNARINREAWTSQEARAIRIFQRKAHLFLTDIPPHDDIFHWLSIMQHHGAPTRLVDFTWSPFVAAFFALQHAMSDSAVFAVCPPMLLKSYDTFAPPTKLRTRVEFDFRGTGNYERYFLPNVNNIVFQGEPYVMNQRLIAQEGTFLVPGVLDRPLEQLATSIPGCDDAVVKFVLHTDSIRGEAMESLYSMNITNATLFPGLDGMARSIAYELEHHWAYDPITMNPVPGFESAHTLFD
ncbi:MAG: FRG domain-containing protein [Methylosarcina sp.]